MRLICPNCGAQYEVPDDVIPEAGRDVQCSNCGNTWYERPGASAAEEEAIDGVTETAAPAPDLEPEQEPEPEEFEEDLYDEPAPEPAYYDDSADDEDGDVDGPSEMETAELEPEEGDAPVEAIPAAVGALARRRSLDPSLASILREEAEREEEVRRREAPAPIETQTEMELDRNDPQAEEAERRKARLMGEPDPVKNGPRRELLPDIEEINSTLRPATDRPAGSSAVETTQQAQKRGFRSGFLGIILIAVIGAVLYVLADPIKAAVPAVAPLLDSYVIWVDGLRGQLHELVSGLTNQMGG